MPHYTVTWTINSEALDPLSAAVAAHNIRTRHDTTANVYMVRDDDTGKTVIADLAEGTAHETWDRGPQLSKPAQPQAEGQQDTLADRRAGYAHLRINNLEQRFEALTKDFNGSCEQTNAAIAHLARDLSNMRLSFVRRHDDTGVTMHELSRRLRTIESFLNSFHNHGE